MSDNCSKTLNCEVFPICDFCFVQLSKFLVLNEITFSWCDVICASTIQEQFHFLLFHNRKNQLIWQSVWTTEPYLVYPIHWHLFVPFLCPSTFCPLSFFQMNSMIFGTFVPCSFVDISLQASGFELCGWFTTLCALLTYVLHG